MKCFPGKNKAGSLMKKTGVVQTMQRHHLNKTSASGKKNLFFWEETFGGK
jgi:hypothetical protein